MLRHQGYSFRLRGLDDTQARALAEMDGQARWLWNLFLRADRVRRTEGGQPATYAERSEALTWLRSRPALAWLADGSAPAQQTVLRNLAEAWAHFFAGLTKPPTFKKKGEDSGFRWSGRQHARLKQKHSRIKLPKLGWVRYRNSRWFEGEVINVAIRRVGRKWQMSIGTEREVVEPAKRSLRRRIGLDMGIACHTATSDNRMLAGPNALRAEATKLRREQRKLSRRKKGSKRRLQQVYKVARIHERIGAVRKNHLHKLTTAIAKSHGLVVIEDLRVANMSRSAKGTIDQPGRNVRAKAALNRRILDQGWGEMRRQLAYKLGWNGGALIAVPPANTSRRCSACQHTDKASRPSQAIFICTACGHEMNADTNAAKNILAMGYAMARAAGSSADNAQGRIGHKPPVELRTLPKTKGIPVL